MNGYTIVNVKKQNKIVNLRERVNKRMAGFMNGIQKLLGESGELVLLVGKTIEKVFIGEDNWSLRFITDNGVIEWNTENDCCNEVWFEHMDDLEALVGATVIEVEGDRWGEWEDISEEDESDEVLEQAFWKIKTNKGVCTIEVRNSHNGYYGGRVNEELSECGREDFENHDDWKKVTEEF
ncbi:hypothetical protein AK40_6171 (plasmid) [Bacillus cereus 03BB108]|uniref:DUF7448 domain-containing protein n=2 Tax=Bacillus cereus TaxID=1396 RepID=A0AAN0W4C9_BACCE|nr:hypothetical protein AK40_6251 [Bacillus cereus 03BB108]AJI08664.1 hypothetical protein AK40_6171 [Bacillus cereus 03BB108]